MHVYITTLHMGQREYLFYFIVLKHLVDTQVSLSVVLAPSPNQSISRIRASQTIFRTHHLASQSTTPAIASAIVISLTTDHN
jgi:hypothetical protein